MTIQTIPTELLIIATGGAGGSVNFPLSGPTNTNTNWGMGNQTNIGTQVINQAPKPPTSMVEWSKLPENRFRMQNNRPVSRAPWGR